MTSTGIRLDGRGAIVTGGASGIGLACAMAYLAAGARVEIWDLQQAKLDAAAALLGGGENLNTRVVDVSSQEQVQAAARGAHDVLGSVDILLNCAGIADLKSLGETSIDIWRKHMAVILDGCFFTTKAVYPAMVERGWGRIIHVSSMAGKEGNACACAYSAAKAGVIGFTKSIGKELARTGVTVNAIAPALFDTPLVAAAFSLSEPERKAMFDKIPMGRYGKVDEAAALALWIASDHCSFTTAFTFDLSGGRATY